MVASYGTIANGGNYIEPIVVLRVEDKHGKVLEEFRAASPEPALSMGASLTLLDAMRGVVDIGTGMAIRSRYGIKADVAGKTGTTQDNTDGWFILMSPTLVAGAWAGFNDNRVTMGDAWGQGARSALPMVGEVFQQAMKAKLVDPALRFGAPPQDPAGPDALGKMNDWFHGLFEQRDAAQAQQAAPEAAPPEVAQPQPELVQPRPATAIAPSDNAVVPSEYQRSEIVRVMPSGQATAGAASGGFDIQPSRPSQRAIEPPASRGERADGPFVVGAPSLGAPSIGQAAGNAVSVAPREQPRPEPAAEPAPQPARGSPSVRFESPPDSGTSEPAR